MLGRFYENETLWTLFPKRVRSQKSLSARLFAVTLLWLKVGSFHVKSPKFF